MDHMSFCTKKCGFQVTSYFHVAFTLKLTNIHVYVVFRVSYYSTKAMDTNLNRDAMKIKNRIPLFM